MARSTPRVKIQSAAPRGSGSKIQAAKPIRSPLVTFLYQDVDYQIDVEKSKVYRRFIEIEKSKQYSIIHAFRAGSRVSA